MGTKNTRTKDNAQEQDQRARPRTKEKGHVQTHNQRTQNNHINKELNNTKKTPRANNKE